MHEVETMMYVGATPWHRLGTKLEAAPTTREAITAAGLDWEVELAKLTTADGQPVTTALATRRKSDNSILGIVGTDYRPLQNAESFSFFDPFLAAGEAQLETAGSLREGARVWILAKINREPSVIVPQSDDKVEKFVLLSNSHDGTMAVRVGFTPIRVVCANTLAMAHNEKASQLIRIRHTQKVAENVEAIREVMNLANQQFEATAEQYRRLAAREINAQDLSNYIKLVFAQRKGDPTDEEDTTAAPSKWTLERVLGNDRSRLNTSITKLFETGRGNDLPGVRGTLWGAYNAVTEYISYERGNDDSKRLDQAWFGNGATRNKRALEIAVSLAA